MNTNFNDHFSRAASSYAAHRPAYPAALVDYLAALPARRELAWDAGCGSGQLSATLAGPFQRVVATDASGEQIRHAPPCAGVDYRIAPAEACGLPDGVVDLAVAAQAAHWFVLPGYYAEVRRVARPGAMIALVSYGLHRVDATIDRVVGAFYEDVLGPYWPEERRHVEAGYRTLAFPFVECSAPPLAMTADWALAEMLGYVDTWSAVRGLERAAGRVAFEQFCEELGGAWGDAATVRRVTWPLTLRVGRVFED